MRCCHCQVVQNANAQISTTIIFQQSAHQHLRLPQYTVSQGGILDWRLRLMVLVTKLWAQYHNINNAKNITYPAIVWFLWLYTFCSTLPVRLRFHACTTGFLISFHCCYQMTFDMWI
ncbi:unnamed protein product [Ceratitis capitata]|uniref:(Mediterranean fruit fly) hypothetical protein n=1 Tax=Ceratitis capitata TaxID=7213 RepID=A0A811USP9_CERCA|nr:unnamed protein product [Ceratitis capitata]